MRLPLGETGALQLRAARVNRVTALLNPAHHSLLIQDVRRAHGDAPFLVQDSVLRAHDLSEIAEQGERQAEVFGETPIAGSSVHADSKDLRFVLIEVSDISLISF